MNDFSLSSLNTKLEDNKEEMIAFVLDFSEDLFKDDFVLPSGEKQTRFNVIFDEINNYIKIKEFTTSKDIQFALYTYSDRLRKEIDFCQIKQFQSSLSQIYQLAKARNPITTSSFDLSDLYCEGFGRLAAIVDSPKGRETTVRFIVFYNRSDSIAINSRPKEYDVITFVRTANFFLDLIFLRKKIKDDEDKQQLTKVFTSLNSVKPKFWYTFESSCNINKLKYFMNLLLANPCQRVKAGDVEKFQKTVEEIVKNFIDN